MTRSHKTARRKPTRQEGASQQGEKPDGHESTQRVIMVMSGQKSVEQPEGQRPTRKMPGRQEIADSQQDPGGQNGVDFEGPDTLLGTALSSQDGN